MSTIEIIWKICFPMSIWVHDTKIYLLFAIFSKGLFISNWIFFVITNLWVALIAFLFLFRITHFKPLWCVLMMGKLTTWTVSRGVVTSLLFILLFVEIKLRHVNELIFTTCVWRRGITYELMMPPLSELVSLLYKRKILLLCKNVSLLINDYQFV
jgi:hypothetical protein